MSNASDIAAHTQRSMTFVRAFTPPSLSRHAKLMPLNDGIVNLRQKGASLRFIHELLATVGVAVGTDTIARFLAEMEGEPEPEPTSKRPRSRTPRQRQSGPRGDLRPSLYPPLQQPPLQPHRSHHLPIQVKSRIPRRHPTDHTFLVPSSQTLATCDSAQLSMSNQINLVINGKGGVGKSFFAQCVEAVAHYEPFVWLTFIGPGVNRCSIMWLAARRKGIARSAALHLDCARSPKRGRVSIHQQNLTIPVRKALTRASS